MYRTFSQVAPPSVVRKTPRSPPLLHSGPWAATQSVSESSGWIRISVRLPVFSSSMPELVQSLAYIKEMAIGLAIILFLIFEPEGLAHRWQRIKAYWKLYPVSY